MSCNLLIDSIVAFRPAGDSPPSRVEITGSSNGCNNIEVILTVDHNVVGPLAVAPDPSGLWLAVFEENQHFQPGSISCDAKVVNVDANCMDPPECSRSQKFRTLNCKIEGNCPSINDIRCEIEDSCNPDGTRTVHCSAFLVPGTEAPVTVQWMHDGEYGAAHVVSTSQSVEDSHDYVADAQEHQACLKIIYPLECERVCSSRFSVPACEVVARCPSIEFLDAVIGDCDSQGRRRVTVRARVTSSIAQSISAQLIGPGDNVLAEGSGGGTVELTGSGQFAPGVCRFTIRIVLPATCPTSTLQIRVDKCPDTGTGNGGGNGGNGQEGGEGTGVPWCLIWFVICVCLIIASGVAIIVAACTGDPSAIGVAIALAIASIVGFVVWGIVCARSSCLLLLWLIGVLAPIIPIAAIIGGILVGLGVPSCGLGAFLDAGYLGSILSIAYFIARCSGCLRAADGSVRCFP